MANVGKEVKAIRALTNGFWASRVLITANNFRLFDHLQKAKRSNELAKELKLNPRGAEILLDALTGLGLLKKAGSRYRNSDYSKTFLVSGSPYYQGDIIRHAETLWQNWSALDDAVRTGQPVRRAHDHRSFILGMKDIAVIKAKGVIDAIGLKKVMRALDLGGGPGVYSIEMAKRGVSTTLFDLPETIEIAQEVIDNLGVKDIRLIGGDFFTDSFGEGYDLVLLSQVIHSLSQEQCLTLFKKIRSALNPRGRLVVHEFALDEDRAHPVYGALFSVNMLVNTEGGRCYTYKEIKGMLTKAGFKRITRKALDDSVVVQGVMS